MVYKVVEYNDVTKWDAEPGGNWVEKYTTSKTFRKLFSTREEACEFIDAKEKRVPRPRYGGKTRYTNYEIVEVVA